MTLSLISEARAARQAAEKRYLVYTSWNGRIHTAIEYGELTNGEGKANKNPNELGRFEISHNTDDIEVLKTLYPLKEEG